MRVGITFDLRQAYLDQGYGLEETAEFDKLETIDGIANALLELGHEPDRIGHASELMQALVEGQRWDLVFNIAEGLRGFGREALVPCLLDAFDIPYTFSDPLVLALCLHKGMCKRIIRDLGIPTADFRVIECSQDVERVDLPFPLFAKPVAEGTGKGVSPASRVAGHEELRRVCLQLLVDYRQPVLLETYLPGREFTVGVLGTGPAARAIGVMEVRFRDQARDVYSYQSKEHYLDAVRYEFLTEQALCEKVEQVALAAWRGLGCRDAGRVDIRADARGLPCFMEANPLAGLNSVHSDLPILGRLAGWSFVELIGFIVDSAVSRVTDARCRAA